MDYDKIKAIVARTENLAGWCLRRVETQATTVIRLPGIYTVDAGKFTRGAAGRSPFHRRPGHQRPFAGRPARLRRILLQSDRNLRSGRGQGIEPPLRTHDCNLPGIYGVRREPRRDDLGSHTRGIAASHRQERGTGFIHGRWIPAIACGIGLVGASRWETINSH